MCVIVWEFLVEPEKVDAFVAAYKSTGAWATLFAQAEGYVGTELLSSTESDEEAKFITIDRWTTAENVHTISAAIRRRVSNARHATRKAQNRRAQTGNLYE